MSGPFAPKAGDYAQVPLLEGERRIREQVATIDGNSLWGGQLVLTDQRLLFQPLDVKAATKLLSNGIDFMPANLAVLGKVVSKALDYTTAYQDGLEGAVPTTAITSVDPGRGPALFHPPSLVLTMDNGNTVEFGILRSKLTPNISPTNTTARDEMVALIRAQLALGGLT